MSHEDLRKRKKRRMALLVILVILAGSALAMVLIGRPILILAAHPEEFRLWVEGHHIWGQLVYIALVVLQILAAIVPGEALEIAGGYAFGALEGTVLCLIGGAVGSFLVILLVRRFGMRLVEFFFPPEKLATVRFLKSSPKRTVLFLFVFMIPGTPKDLLCYFAGLTDMKFGALMLICSLGRIPAVVTSTIGGNALGSEQYIFALIVFVVVFFISMTGLLLYNRICKTHNKDTENIP